MNTERYCDFGNQIEISKEGNVVSVLVACLDTPQIERFQLEENWEARKALEIIMNNLIRTRPEVFMDMYRAIKDDALCYPLAKKVYDNFVRIFEI